MRALHRRGFDHHVLEIPALSVMRETALAGPRLADDRHRLVEALGRLGLRDAETGEFVIAVALADAEIEPPVRQQIERRRLFGNQHRIVPGQHHHRGAEADAFGAGGEIAQQRKRGRDLSVAGEMVLDDEDAVEAQPLGGADIVDVLGIAVAVAARAAARRPRPAEKTEPHRPNPP